MLWTSLQAVEQHLKREWGCFWNLGEGKSHRNLSEALPSGHWGMGVRIEGADWGSCWRNISSISQFCWILRTKAVLLRLSWQIEGSVFISCVCHFFPPNNKLLQPGWLKITETYSGTVLQIRSVKSRCQQGWFFLGAQQENPSYACFLAFGHWRQSVACKHIIPVSASIFTLLSLLYLCVSSLLSCLMIQVFSVLHQTGDWGSSKWLQPQPPSECSLLRDPTADKLSQVTSQLSILPLHFHFSLVLSGLSLHSLGQGHQPLWPVCGEAIFLQLALHPPTCTPA